MGELGVVSGPVCGAALFVALAGGRLPRTRPRAGPRALALRWLWLGTGAALEELVWRGLVFAGLEQVLGPVVALVLSSAGFALWHARVLGRGCAVHAITGLAFGSAYLAGGLAAAILAHATYNVLVDWSVHADRSANRS
jgi:membrane protease YdiL (CAAX protease family)